MFRAPLRFQHSISNSEIRVPVQASTRFSTSVAFRISSIVPMEMRSCVVSGGNGRPTAIPAVRQASRTGRTSRRMSIIRKFASLAPT